MLLGFTTEKVAANAACDLFRRKILHVGDCRAYHRSARGIVQQLTRDHTVANATGHGSFADSAAGEGLLHYLSADPLHDDFEVQMTDCPYQSGDSRHLDPLSCGPYQTRLAMSATGRSKDVLSALRLVRLLALIPRAPYKKSTAMLGSELQRHGFKVTQRTVQRDLLSLGAQFPITSDEKNPAGWSYPQHAEEVSLPQLDATAALAYHMAGTYLQQLFPAELLDKLAPRIAAARKLLDENIQERFADWTQRVLAVPPGLKLLAPAIASGVIEAVHAGLLERRQLTLHYQGWEDAAPKLLSCHPLGLVLRGQLAYLIARIRDYQDVRMLALHRISDIALSDLAACDPPGFKLASYLAHSELDWRLGADVQLHFAARPSLARFLSESRLSLDQQIGPLIKGWHEVRATIADTYELERWLASQGQLLRKVQRTPAA